MTSVQFLGVCALLVGWMWLCFVGGYVNGKYPKEVFVPGWILPILPTVVLFLMLILAATGKMNP